MVAQVAQAVFAGSGSLYTIYYPQTVTGQVFGYFDVAITRLTFAQQPVFAVELYLGALRSAAPIVVAQRVQSIRVRFAGAGSMSARTRFPNTAQASFGGAGSFSLQQANVGQRISARFVGSGSTIITPIIPPRQFLQATFAGAGGMSMDTRQVQRIPIQATFAGSGSLSARPRGPTFNNVTLAGTGSFRPFVQFGTFTDSSVDMDFVRGQYWNGAPGANVNTLIQVARNCSAYAVKNNGSLQSFGPNVLRIVDQGLLSEGERTNSVLWSRDLTNAVWTKTGVIAALDQTDAEGIASSASSLTATSNGGTVMQSITLASSDRAQSVWIKRLAGSGTVEMTQDGSTWTTIPVTNNWARADITFQTISNPIVGLRMGTAGDSIAVDFMQNELGRFSTSPIATTNAAATRLEDFIVPLSQVDTVLNGPSFTSLVEYRANNYVQGGLLLGDQGDNSRGYCGTSAVIGKVFTEDFNGFLLRCDIGSGLSLFNGDVVKSATSYGTTSRSIVAGGGTVLSDTHNLCYTSDRIGGAKPQGSGGGFIATYGYFKRLTFWNTQLSDSRMQMLTLP